MPTFNFTVKDASGNAQEGTVEAKNIEEAKLRLRQSGYTPVTITPVGGAKKKKSVLDANLSLKMPAFLSRVKPKDLTVLTRQLATLVESGLPLLRGLRILTKQTKHPALQRILQGMCESVEGGSTFSEALAQFPKTFDNLYINMTRAGEAAGSLEQSLNRLAEFLEKAQKIKSKVKSAMTYPVVVLVVALSLTGFLMVTVIPKFETLFADMLGKNAQLPPITRFVVGLSHNFAESALPIVGAVVLIIALVKLLSHTAQGKFVFDAIKLRIPVFGDVIRKSSVGRSTRTLGTLMQSGVPVLQALDIVRDTAGNAVISRAFQRIHDAVKEGENMTPSMEASKQFPAMVVSMVDVGEETGALPDMLNRIANTYDGEVDDAVEAMTSIIEPLMIVVLAVIVGTIVIAMFQPLTAIIGQMSGG
ncbi:MAG: type II secretion system F family protein [Kiritimatiellia bacterium]